jgi:hypothetical protein
MSELGFTGVRPLELTGAEFVLLHCLTWRRLGEIKC